MEVFIMGDDRRFNECCDHDFKDKCRRECPEPRCCEPCCCESGNNNIWLIILVLIILFCFCGDNKGGGLFGGLF